MHTLYNIIKVGVEGVWGSWEMLREYKKVGKLS
jgi:hypothetical protein